MRWARIGMSAASVPSLTAAASIAAGRHRGASAGSPAAERSSARKQTAMLVEVTAVEHGSFRPTITAMGTVRPEREIMLSPRVGGEIVALAESFTPHVPYDVGTFARLVARVVLASGRHFLREV